MKFILLVPLVLLIGFIGIFIWRHITTQHSKNQQLFLHGSVTPTLPQGFLKGSVNFKTTWQGKRFDSKTQTGINVFKTDEKKTENYPFTYYEGKGIVDPSITVIKIDYNNSMNPWYLR